MMHFLTKIFWKLFVCSCVFPVWPHWMYGEAFAITERPAFKQYQEVINPYIVQDWVIEQPVDDLPLLDQIDVDDCSKCPRVYIPVCASDNVTYSNICQMHCMNRLRGANKKTMPTVVDVGICYKFSEPFIY